MIAFVFFDLGGVVIRDFSGTDKWEKLKRGIGVNRRNREKYEAVWNRFKDRICLDVDVDILVPLLINEVGLSLPADYSLLMDFCGRFESNPAIWPVINRIRAKLPIGLLTNLYPRMFEAISQRNIMPPVNWDVVVDSSRVMLQKPDIRIFEYAQKLAGISPEKILYIENSSEHLTAAKTLGWQTFWYDPVQPEKSSRDLAGYLDF